MKNLKRTVIALENAIAKGEFFAYSGNDGDLLDALNNSDTGVTYNECLSLIGYSADVIEIGNCTLSESTWIWDLRDELQNTLAEIKESEPKKKVVKKEEKPQLLNNISGTVEDFTAKHEMGKLKAVGLGGKYCDNKTGELVFSIDGNLNYASFHTLFFNDLNSFLSALWFLLSDLYFYDAIDYVENKGYPWYYKKSKSIEVNSLINFDELSNIIRNSVSLMSFIKAEFPQKQDLINHIISILSQKDVECIDLIGLDSDLLEHIESLFEEQTLFFEDESESENEEVINGRVLYSEDNRAIVMIDDCICVVENQDDDIMEECTDYNGTGEKYKETKVIGWTW